MRISILTIDPGTTFWGVSVFHGMEIMTCMVKNLSAKDSSRNRLHEVRKVFEKLCRTYSPDLLVIEKPYHFWERQSVHLGSITKEIKRLSKKRHLKVIELSPKTVRKVICNDENATREHISKAVCRAYPEIKMYMHQNPKYKRIYWRRMFDSIGLGICYLKGQIITK